jgi:hypothetical protein
MSLSYLRPEQPAMRRSTKVMLLLLGSAGVIGAGMVLEDWRENQRAAKDAAASAPEPVSSDRTYTNNTFVPGLGYYHAPFFNWFPFAWNFNDPARGYFAGGQWRSQPADLPVTESRPSPMAVASANERLRALSASRPPGANSSRSSGIFRGGFGSSSRSGVS